MVSRVPPDTVARLHKHFILTNEKVIRAHDIAHNARQIQFDCHHNSYIAICLLKRLGYRDIQWVHGYYQCADRENVIKHSWITLHVDSCPAIILELDPQQLRRKGNYVNNKMPDSQIAMIAHPDRVICPNDLGCTVASAEVFGRYIPVPSYDPDVDYAQLHELLAEVNMHNSENMDSACDS